MRDNMSDVILIERSALIEASSEIVYAILRDYEVGHPAILPEQFEKVEVISGGHGAGTVIDVYMKVMGIRRKMNMLVEEPEPGRVLLETDTASGTKTFFIVEPTNNPTQCRLTLRTEAVPSRGVMGWVERRMLPKMLSEIYVKEIALLNAYAASKSQVSAEIQSQANP